MDKFIDKTFKEDTLNLIYDVKTIVDEYKEVKQKLFKLAEDWEDAE